MSFVIHNLYIGSLEDADDVESMRRQNITRILSVGCSSSNNSCTVNTLSYEDILDKPEQPIIPILQETNEYIKKSITEGSAILVSSRKGLHLIPSKRLCN